MSDASITWLHRPRPNSQPGYDDTAALNDIHALLTTTGGDGRSLLGDIAEVVARSGRPMVRARDIEVTTTETRIGWPVAQVDAEDTTVTVRQDPAGSGLLIEITTATARELRQLTVTLNSADLHRPSPFGGDAA
jgi:hypothetical protein